MPRDLNLHMSRINRAILVTQQLFTNFKSFCSITALVTRMDLNVQKTGTLQCKPSNNGAACYKNCKRLFEYQHLLSLRGIW